MFFRGCFRLYFITAVVCIITCGAVRSASGAPMFLQGEDVMGPDGMVISVNEIRRTPFTGGLGGSTKQDRVEIQLTFVNTGRTVFPVDPLHEYSLQIIGSYPSVELDSPSCLAKPFNVNPGTQSRGTLCFRVDSSDAAVPRLIFRRGRDPELTILCDPELGQLFEKSGSAFPEIEGALKLIKFMIEAERLDIAQKLVEKGIEKFPGDARVTLLAAMVKRRLGDSEGATEAVARISENSGLNKDDALELARQAFELSQYSIAQRILEPYAGSDRLSDKDMLFLARCWYFDRQYDLSEKLLTDLNARGFQDRTLFFTLGNLLEKRDDWRGALRWWEKAVELDQNYYEAEFNIGVGHFKLDDRPGAIEHWRRVLLLEPDPDTRQAAEDAIKSLE